MSAGFAASHVSRALAEAERLDSSPRTFSGKLYTRSPEEEAATDRPSAPASAEASSFSPRAAVLRSMPPLAATSAAITRWFEPIFSTAATTASGGGGTWSSPSRAAGPEAMSARRASKGLGADLAPCIGRMAKPCTIGAQRRTSMTHEVPRRHGREREDEQFSPSKATGEDNRGRLGKADLGKPRG